MTASEQCSRFFSGAGVRRNPGGRAGGTSPGNHRKFAFQNARAVYSRTAFSPTLERNWSDGRDRALSIVQHGTFIGRLVPLRLG